MTQKVGVRDLRTPQPTFAVKRIAYGTHYTNAVLRSES